jgi:hypothetical protein
LSQLRPPTLAGAVREFCMSSIHDNILYAFSISCDERRIVLYTEFKDGTVDEFTDVVFTGVIAHYFENVLQHNILFSIDEVGPEEVLSQWATRFEQGKNFGWPNNIEYRDAADLAGILKTRRVKAFEISSSLGLSGFVLSEKMELRRRPCRAHAEDQGG